MAVRIDRIKINRGGPLDRDFEIEPGNVNLVFGQNESGKSYIVESIIRILFRVGRKEKDNWSLRDWDSAGRIVVSGIEDNPISFAKSGKKLEDYWQEKTGLPSDLSKLLVVQAGETLLDNESDDGVGRKILKNCLSGEGLLDRITSRISGTLQGANIDNATITGHERGELKNRKVDGESLGRLNDLSQEVDDVYASGEIASLRQRQRTLREDLARFEQAKRYRAAQVQNEITGLITDRNQLPTEADFTALASDIGSYETKKADVNTTNTSVEELEGSSEAFRWVTQALSQYKDILGQAPSDKPSAIYIFVALFLVAGTIASGIFGQIILLAIMGVLALILIFVYFLKSKAFQSGLGDQEELNGIKSEYRSRFDSELSNRANLDAKVEEFKAHDILAKSQRNNLLEHKSQMQAYENTVNAKLKGFLGVDQSPEDWHSSIQGLKGSTVEIDSKIRTLETESTTLGVSQEDHLESWEGEPWNEQRDDKAHTDFDALERKVEGEIEALKTLMLKVQKEIKSDTSEWEDLITELNTVRKQESERYKATSAEVLGKIHVYAAIQKFREEENALIAERLESSEIQGQIKTLTSDRYKRISNTNNDGLVVVSADDEEFNLASMSTGAREQIYLALRIGFASIVIDGESAFLILDDAFQHSDWERRKRLVSHMMRLSKSGWQIFYFSMDNHIRDLFIEAGADQNEHFQSFELS